MFAKTITLFAPAKINLFLEVINKRRDGYHNIETVFQKITLCDTIKVSIIRKGIRISCKTPHVPNKTSNLAYVSCAVMKRKFALGCGFEVNIIKRIPVAAGLGGGSSDAASVIIAIDKLFKLNLSTSKLLLIAKRIGADVPFFVSGYNCAIGRGIGERLKPIRHKKRFHLLILVPHLRIYTKTIYSRVSLPLTRPMHSVNIIAHSLRQKKRDCDIARLLYNRLEDIVLQDYPSVREAKKLLSLYKTKGVLLSGSGPSVFGLFSSRKEAIRARDDIKRDGRWRTYLVRTI